MREKPIIFSTPMIRALLDGRKTMTRRVCKDIAGYDFKWGLDREPYIGNYKVFTKTELGEWGWVTLENQWLYDLQTAVDGSRTYLLKCPYGQPGHITSRPTTAGWYDVKWEPGDDWERIWVFDGGDCWGYAPHDDPEAINLDIAEPDLIEWRTPGDRLWVRETFADNIPGCPNGITYRADHIDPKGDGPANPIKWKPSIHMPKAAARIWLDVVSVRVERLQDITYDDCLHEGMWNYGTDIDTLAAFQELWQSLNAKRGYGEEVNPWVWVVEFKRV